MSCDEMILLISGHLDGVNSQEEEKRLQEHLAECASCRDLLAVFQKAEVLLKEQEMTVPVDFCAGVMARIQEETGKKKRSFRLWTTLAASAAAVVLVLGAGALSMPKTASDGAAAVMEEQEELEETAEYSVAKVMYDAAAEPMETYSVTGASVTAPQELADRLGCVVVCFDHFADVLNAYAVEKAEDGTCLYVLTDTNEAEELSQAHGGVIYVPAETLNECAYAIVIDE